MLKAMYKPLALLASLAGGVIAGAVFRQVWYLFTRQEETPKATDRNRRWPEVILASAAEGALFGLVRAIMDRASATGYARVTGAWPGDNG
jgi:hypothetical protein